MDFPGALVVKNLPGSRSKFNPWVGKIPWRKVWLPTPVQYFSLENPMDREAWGDTVHGVAKSWTRLSN